MDLLEELLAERDIKKALARYVRYADDLDAESWVNMFPADGSIVSSSTRLQGHAELRTWIKKFHSGPKMRHMMVNTDITVESPTTARMIVDMALLRAEGNRWVLIAAPRYTDKLIKTDDGWKFLERIIDQRAP